MPIRFRCRKCNQLMGIARRKAGTAVHCPTCQAEVMVPRSDEAVPHLHPPRPAAAPAPLFERSDFEDFLQNPVLEKPSPAAAPVSSPLVFEPKMQAAPALSPRDAARVQVEGLFLSPTQATWLTVIAILLIALAFGAGLLVGHYWMGG